MRGCVIKLLQKCIINNERKINRKILSGGEKEVEWTLENNFIEEN